MQWLPWPDASVAAVGAVAVTTTLRRSVKWRLQGLASWVRELAVVLALYALWQLAGSLSLGSAGPAVARGMAIARWERKLHLPSERSVQGLFWHTHSIVRAANLYYFGLHVAVTGAFLVWLFARHRESYPEVRSVLALATGASLLVALLPVAPPRLVPGLGVLDTARLLGPSVYPATDRPGLDQLSAMPSVHVVWAVVVGGGIVYALRSPWRWTALLYPALTVIVVVITGNHYWADAGVGVLLCALAAGGVALWGVRVARARTLLPGAELLPGMERSGRAGAGSAGGTTQVSAAAARLSAPDSP